MTTTLRRAAVGVAALAAIVSAVPANAGSSYLSRTTGRAASTDWVQVLDLRSRGFGNVHIGWLSAYETSNGVADVFAAIDDYDCPDGELPSGGHGEESNCTYVTSRFLEGTGISFTLDRRLTSARLEGVLNASTGGHEGPGDSLGTVGANFTWNGTGELQKSTATFRYRDNGVSYSETFRSSRRAATMTGVLGPMLFEQAAVANGSIEQFRNKTQSRES
ncbi:MAG TPA: hypothetical protein VNA14_11935 [Mycobacteriales bacterium]|nr:hypothetical protein [Mycobacteriales bacterium]